jgi:hypothetical protein
MNPLFSFTPDISFGNLITWAGVFFAWVSFLMIMRNKVELIAHGIEVMDKRMSSVEMAIKTLTEVTIQIAKQEVKLDSHARRLGEIEEIQRARLIREERNASAERNARSK